jgi:hypothetical protein
MISLTSGIIQYYVFLSKLISQKEKKRLYHMGLLVVEQFDKPAVPLAETVADYQSYKCFDRLSDRGFGA